MDSDRQIELLEAKVRELTNACHMKDKKILAAKEMNARHQHAKHVWGRKKRDMQQQIDALQAALDIAWARQEENEVDGNEAAG